MSHNHGHHHHHHGESSSNIKVAFLLNFIFAVAEVVGGILTGSTAILSDAVHDFGDSLTLGLSYVFEKVGKKKPTAGYTYGFKRLSLLGAMINIIVLTVGTFFVFTEAIESLINPQPVIAEGMFVMAIVGILINGISAFRMSGSSKLLDKTVMMHLMEDLLGWVAVFIVSIVIYFTQWYVLDPILSLVICGIIGKNIYSTTKDALHILMQAAPDTDLADHIRDHLSESHGIAAVETFNMWTLDGEDHVVTATLHLESNQDSDTVLHSIKNMLKEEGIKHSTIELHTVCTG